MIGGDNWFHYQALQYEQNETQIPIGGTTMFTEQWMLDDIVKRGAEVFNYYIKQYESMPSCKYNQDYDRYQDCMVEKCNCCYERVIESCF